MGRILTSPTRAVRAVRVARGEGCFEWGANPPAHPGLSGLAGPLGAGVFSMWRELTNPPRAVRADMGGGCF